MLIWNSFWEGTSSLVPLRRLDLLAASAPEVSFLRLRLLLPQSSSAADSSRQGEPLPSKSPLINTPRPSQAPPRLRSPLPEGWPPLTNRPRPLRNRAMYDRVPLP